MGSNNTGERKPLVQESRSIVERARSFLDFGRQAEKQPYNNTVYQGNDRGPAKWKKPPKR